MNHNNLIVNNSITIKEALTVINGIAIPRACLMVIDNNKKLAGVVAEGDIRRELLKGSPIENSINSCLNKSFIFFKQGANNFNAFEKCKKNGIRFVPELNDVNEIVNIIDTTVIHALLPVTAVLMAGGKGERLKPLTNDIPKPLLKVGEKPIIDYNIDNLISFGVNNFYYVLRHLSNQIEAHILEKNKGKHQMNFIFEDDARGTAGSLSCLKNLHTDYIVLMNSDLLTNINFADLYQKIIDSNSDLVMATIPYYVDIPYAVINLSDGEQITGLTEKPRVTYYSNAGIYIFKKNVLDIVPNYGKYDATDLVNDLLAQGKKVTSFPITGYWLDIGRPEDYLKAQNDIKYLNF